MADAEEIVTELVAALCSVDRIFAERTAELSRQADWSEVTFELGAREWNAFDPSRRSVGFSGYVDGEKAGVGGIGWIFDVSRDQRGWAVERTLNLNANTTSYQETVAELPAVRCADSRELANRLPDLVRELLRLPAPEPASSDA